MIYSKFDTGNYFVIPGSPTEAWQADSLTALNQEQLHAKMGVDADDFVAVIVGSQFMYKGLWLEQALILQALKPLLTEFPTDNSSNSGFKIFVLSGDSTGNYTKAVEVYTWLLHLWVLINTPLSIYNLINIECSYEGHFCESELSKGYSEGC